MTNLISSISPIPSKKAMETHSNILAWRSLVGCSPWGHEESDKTERLHFHFSLLCIGEGNGNPLQCSCLENPRDAGAWRAAVYGIAQSRTRLKQRSSSSHPIDITCSQDQFWGKTETHDFMNSSVSTWKIVFWFNSETSSIKMMLKLPLLSKSCFLT